MTATAVTAGPSITLSWLPSSDNVGVDHYQIFDGDFNSIGSSTSPTFTVTGLTSGTPYSFYLTAVDSAGNSSYYSLPCYCTTITTGIVPDPDGGHSEIVPDESDAAPNQYVPPAYQNYFYSSIVPAIDTLLERVTGQATTENWMGYLQGSTLIYNGAVADLVYSYSSQSYYVANEATGQDLLDIAPDISSRFKGYRTRPVILTYREPANGPGEILFGKIFMGTGSTTRTTL